MSTLRYTKGLPASGKTTFARKMVAETIGDRLMVRANRDDIRAMLGTSTGQYEELVTRIQDSIIRSGLAHGCDVVVDDTNLHKGTDRRFRKLAEQFDAEVVIHDFTEVPVETCIERDKNREASVGEEVIRNMHDRYLGGK